ncbi:response regulator [Pradoshia sp.]
MIRVMIAEDQRMLRGALSSLLELEEDIEIIAQASNGEEAFMLIQDLRPDVCLMDIEMPIKSGIEVAEELSRIGSACKLIILTTFARPGYFERAVKADVAGYLLKDGSSDELADSIRNAMKGKREYAPALIHASLKASNPLSEKEQQILRLIEEGMTSKEIASTLYLSQGTVRNYTSDIINKLYAKNRIEAVSIAKGKGWM